MTWMDARTPAPPPALAERMRVALDAAPAGAPPADAALDAAMLLVDGILRDRSGSRTGAMALLAADALVTRAFEVAGEQPDRIEPLAVDAMIRIAAAAEQAR
jgi:hypothetical protein